MIPILADSDISNVPAEFVKNWWMMVLAVGTLAVQIWFGRNKKREISGRVQTEPVVQHAEKAELSALSATVNAMRIESEARMKAMHSENAESMKAMREENVALHRNAQVSGENRVMAITQDVNLEMAALLTKIGELTKMITTALIDNGTQGEAINNMKAQLNTHQLTIGKAHERIDQIIQAGRSAKRTS